MGFLWGGRPEADVRTEAGFCDDCIQAGFKGRPVSAINVNLAGGDKKDGIGEAFAHFEAFAKNNKDCRGKLGLITMLHNGTHQNVTHIVNVNSKGKLTIIDSYFGGEGVGVGNGCGDHTSPHGFIRIGGSDYRKDIERVNPYTGQKEISRWPQCGSLNPGFTDNRIYLHGMEPGYNDNLSEQDPGRCPDGDPRMSRLHPIAYASGNTTQGCKGMPLEDWCKYAPRLASEKGCIYNYDGSVPPSLKGKSI